MGGPPPAREDQIEPWYNPEDHARADIAPALTHQHDPRPTDVGTFVHLHVHSQLSFRDSINIPEITPKRAAMIGQRALALTDHGHMFGAVRHSIACKEAGVHPIFGMEAYEAVADDLSQVESDTDYPAHLTLLVMNRTGWRNLCRLHTLGHTAQYAHVGRTGRVYPRIDRPLLAAHSEGLICMSACLGGKVQREFSRNDEKMATRQMQWYQGVFGDRFYVELMGNTADQIAILHHQRTLCRKLGIPTVATNDVHYLTRDQGRRGGPHNIFTASRFGVSSLAEREANTEDTGEDRDTTGWYGSDGFYLKSEQEMLDTGFSPAELERTVEIATRCVGGFDPVVDLQVNIPPAPIVANVSPFDLQMFSAWRQTESALKA